MQSPLSQYIRFVVRFVLALGLALPALPSFAGTPSADELSHRLAQANRQSRNAWAQMNAAYGLLARKDPRALHYLERAAELKPRDTKILEQLGYARLAAGNRRGAIAAFRAALAMDPNNESLRLQLVYTQDAEGLRRAAAEDARHVAMARGARAVEGCAAWNTLAGLPDRILPKPWFTETYLAPEYRAHDRLGVTPLQLRVGRALIGDDILSVYGSMRTTWDSRTHYSATSQQVFYDDAMIFAGGLRLRPWEGAPIFAFLEQGVAGDLSQRNRARWRSDTRTGLVFESAWEAAPASCTDHVRFVFTPIIDVYAETIWFSRYQDMIAYARVRPGVRVMETSFGHLEAYGLAAITRDTAGRRDNRFHELGAGIAFKFLAPLRITFRAEAVRVFQTGAGHVLDGRVRLEHEVRF